MVKFHVGFIHTFITRRIMTTRTVSLSALGALALGLLVTSPIAAAAQDAPAALKLTAARVSIAGTSNIHPFTASATDVRMSRLVLAPADGDRLAAATPGGVEAFDLVIRAASLTSPKEGLDKNMHKALKVSEHPEIIFRLARLEAGAAANSLKAVGMLKIAGVEREVSFAVKVAVNASTITVIGEVDLLMTDYGITPPKAMLGMLKTDPKITVTFDTVFAVPQVTTIQ
jgi:polyisoprenoid-binding protein YceI